MFCLIHLDWRGKAAKTLRRFTLLAGIFLFGIFSANAQTGDAQAEPLRLTPGDAVEMAIRNNLNLEMARINLDMQRRASDSAWNQFIPSVGVSGTLARPNRATTHAGMIPVPIPGMDPIHGVVPFSATLPRWNLLGTLSAELVLSFAQFENMRTLQQQLSSGLIGYERARLQMEQGVRKMYNSILLLQANVGLLEESYRNSRRQADMAEASFRAGLAPRLVWLQAQVAVENMRPAVSDLTNTLQSLKGNFALLLGLPHDTPLELQPVPLGVSVIPWDVAELISRAAAGSPDIQVLQAEIMTLQAQQRTLRLQHRSPFLRFGLSLNPTFMGDPLQDTLTDTDNWQDRGNFSITLGMNLNGLFSFTREGQQLRDMEAALQMQNIRLAQTIREKELEIFTMINSLERIRTTVEVQQATVYLAEESYRLTEEAFRAGLQDFQVVQNAALALDQARIRLLTEQFNYINYLIDLEYALGVPFGTLSGNGSL